MDRFMTEYGLASDEKCIQTAAIQNAIDDCAASGGGTVHFQPGIYRAGTIVMRSNVFLDLPAGATLKASDNPADYNAPDAWPQNGASVAEHTTGGHFIVFHEVENCGLVGHGVVDGNGMAFRYRRDIWLNTPPPQDVKRPAQMVWLCEARNVRIQNVQLLNSPYWTCLVIGCQDVIISGVKIKNNPEVPNSDGIDIDASRNIIVSDCLIDSEDDCITFRCDRKRLKNQDAILENVTVTNCQLRTPGCNAFRIGVGNGVIRDCCVSNCVIRGSSKGVCLEARYTGNTDEAPGCLIENIQFSNIFMESQCPLFLSSFCLGLYPVPAPAIRNIRFSNMVIYAREQMVLQANARSLMEGIAFNGVTVEYNGDTAEYKAAAPVQETYGYSEWDHATNRAAFYMANVKDVTLRDVTVRVKDDASPIEALTILDDTAAFMDNAKGTRLGKAMPAVIDNPCFARWKAQAAQWDKTLEDAFTFYGIDPQTQLEMREFLHRLQGTPTQVSLLDKLLRKPDRLLDVVLNAAFTPDDACRFRLLMLLLWHTNIPSNYQKAGYGDDVWKEITGDLMLWLPKMREDLGFAGLNARIASWINGCQTAHIIQQGRLQCELTHRFALPFAVFRQNGEYVFKDVTRDTPRFPDAILQLGDDVINLHIPAAGPLKKDDCIQSIKRMMALKRSQGKTVRCVVCYSWLLGSDLRNLLPEKSNIRDFVDLGHPLPETGDQTNEIKWRLWNKAAVDNDLAGVPLNTSLQKKAYDYLKNGGTFREGAFFILPDEI